jgi:hypothetical protein
MGGSINEKEESINEIERLINERESNQRFHYPPPFICIFSKALSVYLIKQNTFFFQLVWNNLTISIIINEERGQKDACICSRG